MEKYKYLIKYIGPILVLGLVLGLTNTWLYYADIGLSEILVTTFSVIAMVLAVIALALLMKRAEVRFLHAVIWLVVGDLIGVGIMVAVLGV